MADHKESPSAPGQAPVDPHDNSKVSEDEEVLHWLKAGSAIAFGWAADAESILSEEIRKFLSLPLPARRALPHRIKHLQACQAAVHTTSKFLSNIPCIYGAEDLSDAALLRSPQAQLLPPDFARAGAVVRSMYRDWSREGSGEREVVYGPVRALLKELHPPSAVSAALRAGDPMDPTWDTKKSRPLETRTPPRVLVPGCGLARLPVELALEGYRVIANEYSAYMALGCMHAMNNFHTKDEFTIYPWVTDTNNLVSPDDTLTPCTVPDLAPASSTLPSGASFGFASGSFVEIFKDEVYTSAFDAIAATFFLDTADNIWTYATTLARLIRPGGHFIHCGPLEWHWGDVAGVTTYPLSFFEVKQLLLAAGLEPTTEQVIPSAAYCSRPGSMCPRQFDVMLLVCRRVEEPPKPVPPVLTGKPPLSPKPPAIFMYMTR
jgi:carnosine N-methyltransferase